jgi:hypothetical protein
MGDIYWGFVKYVVVSSPQHDEHTAFFPVFPWRTSWLRHFVVIALELQGKKASTIFMTQPIFFCWGNWGIGA